MISCCIWLTVLCSSILFDFHTVIWNLCCIWRFFHYSLSKNYSVAASLLKFMLYMTYFSLFPDRKVLCSSILFDFQLTPMSMLITSLAQGSSRSSSQPVRAPFLLPVKQKQTLSWKRVISWHLVNTSSRSEVLRATLMVRSTGLVTFLANIWLNEDILCAAVF